MSELARKLGLRPDQTICLLDAPEAAATVLREACSAGTRLDMSLRESRYEAIFFWPTTLDGLAERFSELRARIEADGAVWAVMPKKAFARQRGIEFSWEEMQAAGLTTDLVDNKVVSVTSEEYATRFVIRRARRGS